MKIIIFIKKIQSEQVTTTNENRFRAKHVLHMALWKSFFLKLSEFLVLDLFNLMNIWVWSFASYILIYVRIFHLGFYGLKTPTKLWVQILDEKPKGVCMVLRLIREFKKLEFRHKSCLKSDK